ncbi:hypothetical protein AJ80_09520 [Polytolypa hystricis UAMH7299]|uniref:Beta-xylosidase C-terminal Concanavalin A-like domain-containing protein n=1 Tax=Polytolypa hystricis (strain UAMH7299) TaxID=1447883 RepID=A0A2B7WPX6_POLH7|nr:hypothetical protein AJ80_09520 [Polytolypa hystricis UAMH7299]
MAPVKSLLLPAATALLALVAPSTANGRPKESTYYNPIFSGSYPDPSCIFVEEWDDTFFCASSSFNIFPGIPIHASKDLRNWKTISNVLTRHEQLPDLQLTNGSTSGIWAPTIRYHDKTFYVFTTLVHDKMDITDGSRWDNIIFKTKNPFDEESWSTPVHFNFTGYDPSPFWHEDGKVYMSGAHPWQVEPGVYQMVVDLETGETSEKVSLWNGTGGLAPEGSHTFYRDGWYYLLVAEGGTGMDHMVTMARSRDINGPYEPNPDNPILTNANTTEWFQTVGHADLFQDKSGNWWGVALSTRSGPEYRTYPMGRETVMVPVKWERNGWPVFEPVRGEMRGPLPRENRKFAQPDDCPSATKTIDFRKKIPDNFVYWRTPREGTYTVSERGHPNTLSLKPSHLNLTALDGNYAETGQTFIAVRQTDTLFTYSVNVEFEPKEEEEEAGVSVFLSMNHHIDLGIVNLPDKNTSSPTSGSLIPHLRFRAESFPAEEWVVAPQPVIELVPEAWRGKPLTLEIKAINLTHYAFSAGPANSEFRRRTIAYGAGDLVSWGFTGTLIGAYATNNGGEGTTKAYLSNWKYTPQSQFRD